MMSSRAAVRLAVPAVLLVGLVTVMVGCIPIPTFDHVTLTGTKQDFRRLMSSAGDENRSVAGGRLTRAEIERLLGPPLCRSPNDLRTVYTLRVNKGLWLVPLCLSAGPMEHKEVAVEFVYADDGTVLDHYVVEGVEYLSPPTGLGERPPTVRIGTPDPYVVDRLIDDVKRGIR